MNYLSMKRYNLKIMSEKIKLKEKFIWKKK